MGAERIALFILRSRSLVAEGLDPSSQWLHPLRRPVFCAFSLNAESDSLRLLPGFNQPSWLRGAATVQSANVVAAVDGPVLQPAETDVENSFVEVLAAFQAQASGRQGGRQALRPLTGSNQLGCVREGMRIKKGNRSGSLYAFAAEGVTVLV